MRHQQQESTIGALYGGVSHAREFEKLVMREGRSELLSLIHPKDRPRFNRELRSARRCGRFYAEYRVRASDGQYKRVALFAWRHFNIAGRETWKLGEQWNASTDLEHKCSATGTRCYCTHGN